MNFAVNGRMVSREEFDSIEQDRIRKQRPLQQLGDRIERVTKPIARVIDKVAGTKIVGCGGCKKMKERLNSGMSITEAIKRRLANR